MIRTLAAVALLFAVAAPSRADEKPKANALTAKEIADGWIMLFDGETTFGWKIDGAAEVKDGVLILGGKQAGRATPTTPFYDYDLRMESSGAASIHFKNELGEFSFGLPDRDTVLQLHSDYKASKQSPETTSIVQSNNSPLLTVQTVIHSPTTVSIGVPAGGVLRIKALKLRPLGEKPLFNGKNLDGWKQYTGDAKRSATKFT
ncbi:MAG TPA: hypothetical protein VGI99_09590, partial [Gemmataceae bacterium]